MHYLEKIFPLLILNVIIFLVLYFEIFSESKNILLAGFIINAIGLANFLLYFTYYHTNYYEQTQSTVDEDRF